MSKTAALAIELIERCKDAGLSIRADGSALKIKPAERLTDDLRTALLEHKPEVLAFLGKQAANDVKTMRFRAMGYLTGEQRQRVHFPAWTESDCETFAARLALFMGRGVDATQADYLGELLVLRDRDRDDRRLCLECSHYRRASSRCAAEKTILPKHQLHRCDSYQAR
jgi:hypothetical protein